VNESTRPFTPPAPDESEGEGPEDSNDGAGLQSLIGNASSSPSGGSPTGSSGESPPGSPQGQNNDGAEDQEGGHWSSAESTAEENDPNPKDIFNLPDRRTPNSPSSSQGESSEAGSPTSSQGDSHDPDPSSGGDDNSQGTEDPWAEYATNN
jgi:hypothetical protein